MQQEPIEVLCDIFLEMAISDGEIVQSEIDVIVEMIGDLMDSDQNTKLLSKRSPTDAIIIVSSCLEKYIEVRSPDFINKQLSFLDSYLKENEKILTVNMLINLAKSDGKVDEAEIQFFNHVKKSFGFEAA